VYRLLVEPFQSLGCKGEHPLARFYADFTWPWTWDIWGGERTRGEEHDRILEKEKELNAQAELFVMGDWYDRVVGDRLERSVWTVSCEDYRYC
jgi:hypothetical protein